MILFLALALTAQRSPGAVVVMPVADMYSAPSQDSEVVSQATFAASVVVAEEKSGWVKVRPPDNYPGWMPLTALRRYSPDDHPYASVGKAVKVESRFANVNREADLTKHQPLLTLPFEATLDRVERYKLRAGDLLFFGDSPQKITHTGMYLGHGKFIHDTPLSPPGVQISRLGDPPWTNFSLPAGG